MKGLYLQRYALRVAVITVANTPIAAPPPARLPLAVMHSAPTSSIFRLLMLDSESRPGLTAAEFHRMFTQCLCGLVMTRGAYVNHHCRFTIIDLTSEFDEEYNIVDLTTDTDDE